MSVNAFFLFFILNENRIQWINWLVLMTIDIYIYLYIYTALLLFFLYIYLVRIWWTIYFHLCIHFFSSVFAFSSFFLLPFCLSLFRLLLEINSFKFGLCEIETHVCKWYARIYVLPHVIINVYRLPRLHENYVTGIIAFRIFSSSINNCWLIILYRTNCKHLNELSIAPMFMCACV